MIRAIVFDLDNTLTDFMKMKSDAITAAIDGMIDAGLKLPRDLVRSRIDAIYQEQGLEYQRVFDQLIESELGHIDPKILASGIVAYRRARESALVLYPHVQMTLLELTRRGIRLGVVSDAPQAQVWLRLCSLSLQHVFDAVVTFEDTGQKKPSPAPFQEVLRRLGVEPSQAMMIGDWAERDVVGAASLGMKTVFARYGDTFDTQHSGADYEIDDVHELVAIVDGLHRGSGAHPPRSAPGVPVREDA
ncbi:MAG: HAD-IA family hydrolase [Candidatus Eisenbacteria bacterium]|uniref:HAD-IA family hydrolase n=1 Tax=Eiseniibacteriota bacterium TaxID=2212470 RepID=A0A9D6QJF2_UNCEI|nr:HAD-IA family hydrolase [Candidatus Eisenbacteria bacterium]MBI3540442.1 HAD-IA family hydrolase [Candidatus Eisenbacteria bacterium]